MTGTLYIARHHESLWNKEGRWTGTRDVHLTGYGRERSFVMGKLVAGVRIDCAFASEQMRTLETLKEMLRAVGEEDVPIVRSPAINERDYGEYTGKNKWEMEKKIGEEAFNALRREWDYPVPGGETLKMVSARAIPFYLSTILPLLGEGKNVLVVSHGNTIRALMKYIERIPDEEIKEVEMLFGAVVIYVVDGEGYAVSKEIRSVPSEVRA